MVILEVTLKNFLGNNNFSSRPLIRPAFPVLLKLAYFNFPFALAGYLVLAGRVRKAEEAEIVLKALEKHTKRKVDTDRLFNRKSHSVFPVLVHSIRTDLK